MHAQQASSFKRAAPSSNSVRCQRRQICPIHVAGLIGPGERKSMHSMADRLDPARYDCSHHVVSDRLTHWDDLCSSPSQPAKWTMFTAAPALAEGWRAALCLPTKPLTAMLSGST
jgi:hypothetical protein